MEFKIIKKVFFLAFISLFLGIFSGRVFLLHKKKRQLEVTCEITHKPIYVIVLSDDEKVLQSAISQDYDNFKIFHLTKNIDNSCSVKNLHKLHFDSWRSKKENISKVVSKLDPKDIFVIIDEKCWFAHNHVLTKINHVFNSSDISALSCKQVTYPHYELLDENIFDLNCALASFFLKDQDFQSGKVFKTKDVLFFTNKINKRK